MGSLIVVFQQNVEFGQLVLALDLHLHDHVDTLLFRDKQIGHHPEVVPVLVEAHGSPFVSWYLAVQRDPVIAPARQCSSDRCQN